MKKEEYRSMERFDMELPSTLSISDKTGKEEMFQLDTGNVCAGGAFFPTDQPLPVGIRVKICMLLPFAELKKRRGSYPQIEVRGQVIRTEKTGMAVCFDKNEGDISFPPDEISVHIIGPNRLQNRLLVFFLEKTAGLKCSCASFSDRFQELDLKKGQKCLILIDCIGLNLAEPDKRNEIKKYLRNPETKVAFFNFCSDRQIESTMLEMGIQGVFHQHEEPDTFIDGIVKLTGNELRFSGQAFSDYVLSNHNGSQKNQKEISESHSLTTREKEILLCILDEKCNKDIAAKLYISPHTVKTHIFHIFKKINVKNRMQALFWAAKYL